MHHNLQLLQIIWLEGVLEEVIFCVPILLESLKYLYYTRDMHVKYNIP